VWWLFFCERHIVYAKEIRVMVSVRVSYSNSVSATSLKGIIDFFYVLNADMPMHWLASPPADTVRSVLEHPF